MREKLGCDRAFGTTTTGPVRFPEPQVERPSGPHVPTPSTPVVMSVATGVAPLLFEQILRQAVITLQGRFHLLDRGSFFSLGLNLLPRNN